MPTQCDPVLCCPSSAVEPRERRDQLKNPLWIEDKALRKGKVEYLPPNEIQFWKDLIGQYLWPLDEDKEEKVRAQTEEEAHRHCRIIAAFIAARSARLLLAHINCYFVTYRVQTFF